MFRRSFIFSALLLGIVFSSCSVYQTFKNISRLKFQLGSVNNLLLNGVSVSNKSRLQDFSAMDLLNFTTAVTNKKLPVSFTLNVLAQNPNNGTGGYPRTDVSLKSFAWKLLIDDKETITGNISSPVSVPGVGEATTFPLTMQLDLFQFFGDKGYQGLIDLALRMSGNSGAPLNVKLVAKPTISSMLGDITYPNDITIIQKEYR